MMPNSGSSFNPSASTAHPDLIFLTLTDVHRLHSKSHWGMLGALAPQVWMVKYMCTVEMDWLQLLENLKNISNQSKRENGAVRHLLSCCRHKRKKEGRKEGRKAGRKEGRSVSSFCPSLLSTSQREILFCLGTTQTSSCSHSTPGSPWCHKAFWERNKRRWPHTETKWSSHSAGRRLAG